MSHTGVTNTLRWEYEGSTWWTTLSEDVGACRIRADEFSKTASADALLEFCSATRIGWASLFQTALNQGRCPESASKEFWYAIQLVQSRATDVIRVWKDDPSGVRDGVSLSQAEHYLESIALRGQLHEALVSGGVDEVYGVLWQARDGKSLVAPGEAPPVFQVEPRTRPITVSVFRNLACRLSLQMVELVREVGPWWRSVLDHARIAGSTVSLAKEIPKAIEGIEGGKLRLVGEIIGQFGERLEQGVSAPLRQLATKCNPENDRLAEEAIKKARVLVTGLASEADRCWSAADEQSDQDESIAGEVMSLVRVLRLLPESETCSATSQFVPSEDLTACLRERSVPMPAELLRWRLKPTEDRREIGGLEAELEELPFRQRVGHDTETMLAEHARSARRDDKNREILTDNGVFCSEIFGELVDVLELDPRTAHEALHRLHVELLQYADAQPRRRSWGRLLVEGETLVMEIDPEDDAKIPDLDSLDSKYWYEAR